MGVVRGSIGAVVGAALAGAALRARQLSRERGTSIVDVLPDLPELLRDDAGRIAEAAQGALADGRAAARRREGEINEELAHARRMRGST
jgi:hypothetical protein